MIITENARGCYKHFETSYEALATKMCRKLCEQKGDGSISEYDSLGRHTVNRMDEWIH